MYQKKDTTHICIGIEKKKEKEILESDILSIVFFSAYAEFGLHIPLNRFM